MTAFLETLARFGDLVLVVLGFSLIIVIHELGHFVAARWAKIRVLAFAVGFGPALVSYRRGLGWRRGSSEPEYKRLAGNGDGDRTLSVAAIKSDAAASISPTEYRLNVLPFGGYVKMLGQDDANPSARSDEPDSYQNCKPWKRMIVISAGVIFNIITAAILFVVVFMAGLRTEPAKVGAVEAGSPAATAVASNAAATGVFEPGLRSGDEIVSIDGEKPLSFNDLVLASAMARRGRPLELGVKRAGVSGVLNFSVIPVEDPITRLLYVGIRPAASTRLQVLTRDADRMHFMQIMADRGVPGTEAGMTLKSVDGRAVHSIYDLFSLAEKGSGEPLPVEFSTEDGRTVKLEMPSWPRMMRERFMVSATDAHEAQHLLGLMPVLAVDDAPAGEGGAKAGMRAGDVFSRVGAIEWPSVPSGISEIRAHAGKTVPITIVRKNSKGDWEEKNLGNVRVSREGKIGFSLSDSSSRGPWVGTHFAKSDDRWGSPKLTPGTRIVAVNGTAITTLRDVRRALFAAAKAANEGETSSASTTRTGVRVTLTTESPLETTDQTRPTEDHAWELSPDAVSALLTSPFEPALEVGMFELEHITLKASGPVEAMRMGVRETQRVMLTTYVTFARLFQGSIKVEHLKGPIGIAHVGTLLAERGFVWLLFFMALISVNLAVINFLPMPIADGGHFVFLLYEQITGKPVSAGVQNAAAIAGLIVLAAVFLIVTYNDIHNLFRG